MELRPYQKEAVDAVFKEWESVDSTLIVLPTGTGKTICMASVTQKFVDSGKKVLILAHRGDLLEQAQDKFLKAVGLDSSLEKAEAHASLDANVVVASVQTLSREDRLNQYPKDHFKAIIIDEAHHAVNDTYKRIIEYFEDTKLLGVTATPNRSDLRSISDIFETTAYKYDIKTAIDDGWLSNIAIQRCGLQIDISDVNCVAGDYQSNELGEALEPYLEQIADQLKEKASDRKTLVFVPVVSIGEKFADILNEKGFKAACISAKSKDRNQIKDAFLNGELNVVTNAMLWCLDSQTEILTDKGFVGMNELSHNHKVANWNFDNSVFFEEPINIIKRPMYDDEKIISVDSRVINFRVTDNHNMIVKNRTTGKYNKIHASEINTSHVFPTNGVAAPFMLSPFENIDYTPTNRQISYTKYQLIHGEKLSQDEAEKEARRRLVRKHSMRYLNPSELTLAQCRFIGFWIADGSINHLRSSGVEYKLSQSVQYPKIIEWIDNTLSEAGLDYVKRNKERKYKKNEHWNDVVEYSLPRGTGGGSQERNGVYELEPYLNKSGTELFWGLNEVQFDALLEGYWYGDGFHGKAENGFPKNIRMRDTNKEWLELLCAIGCVRGWRCSIYPRPQSNPKHKMQYELCMKKGADLHMSHKTIISQENSCDEQVWCVTTTSGNIITRRNGRVMVVGNCEGFDDPSVDCIVNLRATRSKSLFRQIVGRGLRLFPGKENCLILDFLWHTSRKGYDILSPIDLFVDKSDIPYTEQFLKTEEMFEIGELSDLASGARMDAAIALAKQLRQAQNRHFGNRAFRELDNPNVTYLYDADTEDLDTVIIRNDPVLAFYFRKEIYEWAPTNYWQVDAITDKQAELLSNIGVDKKNLQFKGQASEIIDAYMKRKEAGLCSFKQANALKKRGYRDTEMWSSGSAAEVLSAIADNHWKIPRNMPPQKYRPKDFYKYAMKYKNFYKE